MGKQGGLFRRDDRAFVVALALQPHINGRLHLPLVLPLARLLSKKLFLLLAVGGTFGARRLRLRHAHRQRQQHYPGDGKIR